MFTLTEIGAMVDRAVQEMRISSDPANLYEPIRYMMSMGGKKIRPNLCLASYNLFSDEIGENEISQALALEVFHEFTLIHDDIMDRADTRRGKMTVFKKWNENVGILSGDAMMILSYKYISQFHTRSHGEILNLFTQTALQVCEGQQYDMDFENVSDIKMDDYLKMIGLKTAVLIACATRMGALMAGAPQETCQALYEYGYQLGMAFQITDDYLDTFGDEKVFGKKIGGDIANNKKSWLLVECTSRAEGEDRAQLESIMAMGEDRRDEKVAAMQNLYVKLGVKDAAKEAILQYYDKAMSSLGGADFTREQISRLGTMAEQLVHREK